MNRKWIISAVLLLFSGFVLISAQTSGNNVVDVILGSYSAKNFSTIPVSDKDIDLIVKCGLKAPSGRNYQPWKFAVVKDQVLNSEILKNIVAGNILIVICGQVKEDGTVNSFDCALATENMYVAASALGLGAHIYGSPVSVINTNLKEKLGIPAEYKAVTVLRIGNIEKSIDAVSSASSRKNQEEVVIYR
jgi:nitroreductase